MFTATVGPEGLLTAGALHSVYPPHPRCSPGQPFLSAVNPVRGGGLTEGDPARLVLEYDYLPYDHARCALQENRPDRRRNVYHRIDREPS